jgi:hypothetical protein
MLLVHGLLNLAVELLALRRLEQPWSPPDREAVCATSFSSDQVVLLKYRGEAMSKDSKGYLDLSR